MAERRALVEGVKAAEADRSKEKAFVFGDGELGGQPPAAQAGGAILPPARNVKLAAGRVPLTTRIRPELAGALKRVSLERQLEGVGPSAVQDIVEEALERWLADDARPR